MSKQKIATGPAALAFLAVTVLTLGLWAAVGGPVVTDGTSGTALPEKLGKNPAPGRTLRMPTGTDQRGAYWVDTETMPAGTTPGQVPQLTANTVTATARTTGTQTMTATGTNIVSVSVTGTTTGTVTVTGATGTYTYTATSTVTGLSTAGYQPVGTSPEGLGLYGDTLYVAVTGASQFRTVNVANPASMSLINAYATCSNPRGIAPIGSGLLIGCSNNYTEIWNCGDPNSCYRSANIPVDDVTYGVSYYQYPDSEYVLIANSNDNTVQTISRYSGLTGTLSIGTGCSPHGVTAITNTRGAVACSTSGRVYAFDYSSPDSPQLNGYVTVTAPYGLYSWGDRYVAVAGYGNNTVHIIDANDPNNPQIIGQVYTGDVTGPYAIAGHGAYLYVTLNGSESMGVIGVADPAAPALLGTIAVGTHPMAIVSNGNWAFVALLGGAVKSVDVRHWQTLTGTRTTTNTMTTTGTVTQTQTASATATQTVQTTGTYTYTATSTAYGTSTSWTVAGGNLYDPAGTFFLSSMPSEGGNFPGYLRWGEIPIGYETPTSYSAICQTGSDGLIATVWPMSGTNLIARKRMIAGWWKSQLLARVNTNGAAIRVEVWSRDGAYDDTGVKLFDWTTQVFTNTTARAVVTEAARLVDDSLASNDRLRVFFKLYATCSAATTVTIDLGDSAFSSRIYSPFLGDKIDSAEVAYGGAGIGETAKAALDNYANARRTARRFMVPISQFPVVNGATVTTLGAIPDRLSAYLMHDGQTDDAGGALITLPMDMVGTSVSVVPVWAPETTASSSLAKIRWSSVHKVLQHYSLQSPVDAIAAGTTTTWSGRYCYSDCVTNYIQEYDGYQLDGLLPGDTIMLDIRRLGADAADTLPAGAYLIGVQIQYASSL